MNKELTAEEYKKYIALKVLKQPLSDWIRNGNPQLDRLESLCRKEEQERVQKIIDEMLIQWKKELLEARK